MTVRFDDLHTDQERTATQGVTVPAGDEPATADLQAIADYFLREAMETRRRRHMLRPRRSVRTTVFRHRRPSTAGARR